ncbi:hypothetical protein EVAR_95011_1 [Eumeta japonica]|uniref:BRISC and BRCA1-A complex member 2 n=1 Tax=Eumeta variegata TaxID=151549 RepID=A0A4C1VUH2_EUMVA|nr:hypothetical protein EVAR_95011_1 [Eumeta japonica]
MNQFRLVLPYCSRKLKWEIIFDHSAPWFAPDFRFDDESFLNDINDDFVETHLPSLAYWEKNNPKALVKVVSELINVYKMHQIKKLNEDETSRAYFEYSALLGDAKTSLNDVEVWVNGHIVEFLIKLQVNVSRLPELYNEGFEHNPGLDSALLLVRYPNSTNAELILSPLLTKALGNICLPPMHQDGVLMDYVPTVTELINNRIQTILNAEKLKRELLAKLIIKYEGAILEHDANGAAFLFELNDFHWILQIEIANNFPEKLPTLVLRSVYHCTKGKPRTKVLSACPYNNFEEYIEQQVEIFKNDCKTMTSTNQLISLDSSSK